MLIQGRVSTQLLHNLAVVFLTTIFREHKLPVPLFQIKKLRGRWGYIESSDEFDHPSRALITIGQNATLDDEALVSTLLHELVHYVQLHTQGEMDHGKSFKRYRQLIKRTLNIDIR